MRFIVILSRLAHAHHVMVAWTNLLRALECSVRSVAAQQSTDRMQIFQKETLTLESQSSPPPSSAVVKTPTWLRA
jgi:hypothetical protein